MSERATLRGSRLGGTSFEDESGIEFAPRQRVIYDCPHGHEFDIPWQPRRTSPSRGSAHAAAPSHASVTGRLLR